MSDLIDLLNQNSILFYTATAVISLCIGSFLNVVIFRTPKMMEQAWQNECKMLLHPNEPIIEHEKLSLNTPRSHCRGCKALIHWYQNIPLVSWLVLRGKCSNCHEPISIRYPFIELLTCICSVVIAYSFGPSLHMIFALIFTWLLITLSFIDFDTQYLPDRFTFTLLGLGLAANSMQLFVSPVSAIWGAIIGFLCLWVVCVMYKIITGKDGMGYGDFKLLAALGACLGPLMLPLIILLSSLLGSIIGIILMKKRKESLPFAFGPYIALAGWIALIWGNQIMQIYLGSY
ncbi:prepilin peptidase [Acinetobacter boissieri]|uniref:Prepilin leader peptidase/N-methyltransferase n=1 Tax=Acinetobacter boissieri TaxID=1219383 RepID=A0A1G6I142_9GAMM|nr:A24 family peptidase [Acinetobacter boissieri]SDC00252.1 type 4 prepilin peptidase 1 Aspartic peptidase. MEROPS family A24A [Acinetobacter boissieri]